VLFSYIKQEISANLYFIVRDSKKLSCDAILLNQVGNYLEEEEKKKELLVTKHQLGFYYNMTDMPIA